jgi:hypothetical protein
VGDGLRLAGNLEVIFIMYEAMDELVSPPTQKTYIKVRRVCHILMRRLGLSEQVV